MSDTNEDKVLKFMIKSDKPLKAGEIAESLNMDSKEVNKIIKSLKQNGKVHSPKRCYWEAVK